MSKISKLLQCSDCADKLNEICDTLEYNGCEREIVAEVLLYLEMQKLKEKSVKKLSKQDIITDGILPDKIQWGGVNPLDNLYTVKC